ncbi:hypothetical protein ACLQ2P_22710 [Actinomadura citrea]|uniref:hypothetical protein n=1 Tax=Actinomadura citrea TaxID=46158 RepID=UPI003CE46A89
MNRSKPGSIRISSLILRAGVPIPPPKGPARQQQCCGEGLDALQNAKRSYGKALRQLDGIRPGVMEELPRTQPGVSEVPRGLAKTVGQQRVEQWSKWKHVFDVTRSASQNIEPSWKLAEENAREALKSAVNAYNWLDDLTFELPRNASIYFDDGKKTFDFLLEDVICDAHDLVHRAGELVGGIFGCIIKNNKGEWKTSCQTSIVHSRFGFSPGMTVRHICSICGIDPGDCDHIFGDEYLAAVAKFNGQCNVCNKSACNHIIGEMCSLKAFEIYTDIESVREISIVARPRDPLARMTARTIDDEKLMDLLGYLPSADALVLCHMCMLPCTGFEYFTASRQDH